MNEHRAPASALAATEASDPRTRGLDVLATADFVALFARDGRDAAEAVAAASPAIARAIDAIAARLRAGGRLHYVGAGTSGRLAMLDAAECPPTFGTAPELVVAHVAGGAAALVRAVEGAEDDAAAGEAAMHANIAAGDAVVGLSASGGAPYVVAALTLARRYGALTVGVTSVAGSGVARAAEIAIVTETGAESLAGSTRLKAGTAQKLVLNALSTGTMIRLGRVYDNAMVDVVATNAKLRARALRLVRELAAGDAARARALLAAADGSVKVALAMGACGIDAGAARARRAAAGGVVGASL
ncbi:MAG: N-acetylmuramic acid 6-phosphate etherase [Vulcanimicrobiaceae bacterium]